MLDQSVNQSINQGFMGFPYFEKNNIYYFKVTHARSFKKSNSSTQFATRKNQWLFALPYLAFLLPEGCDF